MVLVLEAGSRRDSSSYMSCTVLVLEAGSGRDSSSYMSCMDVNLK
jgi:hypothetical protein